MEFKKYILKKQKNPCTKERIKKLALIKKI